jgi:hypothetical protein
MKYLKARTKKKCKKLIILYFSEVQGPNLREKSMDQKQIRIWSVTWCTKYQISGWKHEQKIRENWFTELTDKETDGVQTKTSSVGDYLATGGQEFLKLCIKSEICNYFVIISINLVTICWAGFSLKLRINKMCLWNTNAPESDKFHWQLCLHQSFSISKL